MPHADNMHPDERGSMYGVTLLGDEAACDQTCPGNTANMCGGNNHFSVRMKRPFVECQAVLDLEQPNGQTLAGWTNFATSGLREYQSRGGPMQLWS